MIEKQGEGYYRHFRDKGKLKPREDLIFPGSHGLWGRAETGTQCSSLQSLRSLSSLRCPVRQLPAPFASPSAEMRPQGPLDTPSWVGRGGLPQGGVLQGPEDTWFA